MPGWRQVAPARRVPPCGADAAWFRDDLAPALKFLFQIAPFGRNCLQANNFYPHNGRFEVERDGRTYPSVEPPWWRRPAGLGHPDGAERSHAGLRGEAPAGHRRGDLPSDESLPDRAR